MEKEEESIQDITVENIMEVVLHVVESKTQELLREKCPQCAAEQYIQTADNIVPITVSALVLARPHVCGKGQTRIGLDVRVMPEIQKLDVTVTTVEPARAF